MNRLNRVELLNHFSNDSTLFEQVIFEFCQEAPQLVRELSYRCERKEWKDVSKAAHKLHEISSNFLENPVSEISKQIEVLTQRDQTNGILALSKHLNQQVKELCSSLSAFIHSEKKAS